MNSQQLNSEFSRCSTQTWWSMRCNDVVYDSVFSTEEYLAKQQFVYRIICVFQLTTLSQQVSQIVDKVISTPPSSCMEDIVYGDYGKLSLSLAVFLNEWKRVAAIASYLSLHIIKDTLNNSFFLPCQ